MSSYSVALVDLMGRPQGNVMVDSTSGLPPQAIVYGTRVFIATDTDGVYREAILGQAQAVAPATSGLLGDKNEDPTMLGWPCRA